MQSETNSTGNVILWKIIYCWKHSIMLLELLFQPVIFMENFSLEMYNINILYRVMPYDISNILFSDKIR